MHEPATQEKHDPSTRPSSSSSSKIETPSSRPIVIPEVRHGFPISHDIEAPPPSKPESLTSSTTSSDPYFVTWTGPSDPENPKNWPLRRRWAATFIVSCFTFLSPVSSSMVAPALETMSKDLGLTSSVQEAMVLSIFVLAYAVGPLFLGPLSEVYGRVRVIQASNAWYLAWNLGCGFARSGGQMMAFRFLSGLGGSAPLAIGSGVLSDCWRAEERGKATSIYTLGPLIGPALGPILGGFVADHTTWRWVFWATSILTVLVQVLGFVFLQETYTPTLLKRKAAALRLETGNLSYHTEYDTSDRTLFNILFTAFHRPFKMLFTQPIIQVIAVYMAYLYGLMYLLLSTFPRLWTTSYHQSISMGSLNYVSIGLGFFLGTQISAPINDRIYVRLARRSPTGGRSEFRIPLMFLGSAIIPAALFLYGWTAQAHTHWIFPNLGAGLYAAGSIVCFQSMQTYIVDSYTRYAASGVAAAVVLRSLAGFAFPLWAPTMYNALGYGWGGSVLGFVAIGVGMPAPWVFWRWGSQLRARSRFAAG